MIRVASRGESECFAAICDRLFEIYHPTRLLITRKNRISKAFKGRGTIWVARRMKRERFALVTIAPTIWLIACTTTAGLEKVFSADPNVGFISHALGYRNALAAGQLIAPAKSAAEMARIIINDYIDATLAGLFVLVVAATVVYALINIWKAMASPRATAVEIGFAGAAAGAGNV